MSDAALIAELTQRLEQLEAQVQIRAVMHDYMTLCDHLDARTDMQRLGDLFAPDAVWTGKGARYGMAFGAHRGRAAILAMLDAYRSPPHFMFNAHFLTSEAIAVDHHVATGRWLMLQTATYASGTSELRSARLTIEFVRAPNAWQISRFETENLFSRPMAPWDDPTPTPVPGRGPATAAPPIPGAP